MEWDELDLSDEEPSLKRRKLNSDVTFLCFVTGKINECLDESKPFFRTNNIRTIQEFQDFVKQRSSSFKFTKKFLDADIIISIGNLPKGHQIRKYVHKLRNKKKDKRRKKKKYSKKVDFLRAKWIIDSLASTEEQVKDITPKYHTKEYKEEWRGPKTEKVSLFKRKRILMNKGKNLPFQKLKRKKNGKAKCQ